MRAFVHDVSPGLANPARRLVHVIFHSAHHCALTTWRYLAPAAPDGSLDTGNPDSTSTTAPLARLPRPQLHHPTLSATSTSAQKGYRLLGNLIGYHSSHNFRDASTATTVVGMSSAPSSDSSPVSPSASLRCDCGEMLSIMVI